MSMELRRARPKFIWIAVVLLAGLVTVWASQNGWELRILLVPVGSGALLVLGLIAVLGALAGLANSFRPAPMALDESGLRLRVAGINQFVPWASVDAVILEPCAATLNKTSAPRLLLVPSAGANLGVAAEYKNKVDGRSSIILLPLDTIRETYDQVVDAFATYAGQRFVNGVSGFEMGAERPGSTT
jgi:hypothetical protein